MYYLHGPCDVTARIDTLSYFLVRIGRLGEARQIVSCPSLAAAKRAGKRAMRRVVIEVLNEANNMAIDCDEWLRVNR